MSHHAPYARFFYHVGSWPARLRLGVGLGLALLAYLLLPGSFSLVARLLTAWDVFAFVSLGLLWAIIATADGSQIRGVATAEDPGRGFLFGFVLVGASVSLLAVVLLLSSTRRALAGPVLIAVAAVAAAWLLLHTIFTLRYAHFYYDPQVDGREGGLEFPGNDQEPDYLDFAYFAFVVGMTAQTADIGISSRTLRRLALLHGVLSYGFNTAIVALSISALAGVL